MNLEAWYKSLLLRLIGILFASTLDLNAAKNISHKEECQYLLNFDESSCVYESFIYILCSSFDFFYIYKYDGSCCLIYLKYNNLISDLLSFCLFLDNSLFGS